MNSPLSETGPMIVVEAGRRTCSVVTEANTGNEQWFNMGSGAEETHKAMGLNKKGAQPDVFYQILYEKSEP